MKRSRNKDQICSFLLTSFTWLHHLGSSCRSGEILHVLRATTSGNILEHYLMG
ncbi:hypothetical protein Nmel_008470 [Mimus melanotis]